MDKKEKLLFDFCDRSDTLKRYRRKDITLTLPDGKTMANIKWFAVWCDEFSVSKKKERGVALVTFDSHSRAAQKPVSSVSSQLSRSFLIHGASPWMESDRPLGQRLLEFENFDSGIEWVEAIIEIMEFFSFFLWIWNSIQG